MRKSASLLVLALATHGTVWAQDQQNSQEQTSQVRDSQNAGLAEQNARAWGLSKEDWQRYQTVMQGPRGYYSPGLDPLTALGIEADSDADRSRFAELQARAEAERVRKELLYQQAYDVAAKRLTGGTQPVNLPSDSVAQTSPAVAASGKLALFVKAGCSACDLKAKQLQAQGSSFDIYMIGTQNDDAVIRKWALSAGIDPVKVHDRTITLNHDRGRWMSIGGQGELPALLRQVNGQWQRQ